MDNLISEKNKKLNTVNFYSYKGGVGRTLLVSHMARCLAALGKKVVIADFDFDAPGIPLMFNIDVCNVSGGLYNLVYDHIYPNDEEEKLDFSDALKQYLVPIDIKLRGENETGGIQILPCGCINYAYWQNIFRIKWLRILATEGKDSFVHVIENNLKPALKDMGIDYLLIDSRAGVTYYSNIARKVATVEAMIFCPNEEAMFSLKNFLLPLVTNNSTSLEKFLLVVSRIPPELIEQKNLKIAEIRGLLKQQLTSEIFESTTLLTLSSDLEVQLDSKIRSVDERYKTPEDGKNILVFFFTKRF